MPLEAPSLVQVSGLSLWACKPRCAVSLIPSSGGLGSSGSRKVNRAEGICASPNNALQLLQQRGAAGARTGALQY